MDPHEQRMNALQAANRIRTGKKAVRLEVKAALRLLSNIVEHPPEVCRSAKIGDALKWAPGIGRVKATTIMRGLYVSPSTTLADLPAGKRGYLVGALRDYEAIRRARRLVTTVREVETVAVAA